MRCDPRLLVMIRITLRKSTVTPEGVGQSTLLHDLQQHVEHVGVCLLDLVQEDDGVRATTHLLGELTTLFVADVAGGRSHEARSVVLLHVLAHVDRDDGFLVTEHELRELLAEVGLPDARRAEEYERTHRATRVLQA